MQFGQEHKFWLAVAIATAFKIITSHNMSWPRAALTVAAAVFSSWAFTEAVIDLFELEKDVYLLPVGALLALTGEGAMRWLTNITPDKLIDLIKKARS